MTKSRHIDILLRMLVIKGASDLHVQVDTPPIFRVHGLLSFSDLEPVSDEDIESYVYSIMNAEQKRRFEEFQHIDLSYAVPGVSRFRVNVYRQRGNIGTAMRVIPFETPTIEQWGLPPVIRDLASKPHGLVVVTGPAGSGKSTTLAAVVDYINNARKGHVITIEEPIEFLYQNKSCLINQREVGLDTDSFSSALRDALREDPDVIMVGEMRDLDTISNAITAAETGHLVFATLHTNSAAQTVDRMIDVFPPHQQSQIRAQLAATLQGVVAQQLVRKKDGTGRVAAFEIMLANPAIRNLIKDSKTNQIETVIQTSAQEGMKLLRDSLKDLCRQNVITEEEALTKVSDPRAFKEMLKTL